MKAAIAGLAVLFGASAAHAREKHVQVTNQAWIDKVGISPGSHGLRYVKPYLKVQVALLDGPIAEVGFRNRETGENQGQRPYLRDWHNQRATKQYGGDYFGFELGVSSDFHQGSFTGPFYVKTTKGTYYWVKAPGGKDFVIDRTAYDNAASLRRPGSADWDPATAIPTQRRDGFGGYYNPFQLR
ncbi:MAG: hypothetical protein IT371_06840 [Deltaproteobacteria bacterium]|nr:hypothetical protein [Deltaproteobacteria bacterium]